MYEFKSRFKSIQIEAAKDSTLQFGIEIKINLIKNNLIKSE